MFRKKLVSKLAMGLQKFPCEACNFSGAVLYSGKKIVVVPCLCVKNKEN
jgi:hypothetical protein